METQIPANLAAVRSRIHKVCERVSRDPTTVSLVVVTKYSEPEAILEVLTSEHPVIIGESRVQDIKRKLKILSSYPELSKEIRTPPPHLVPLKTAHETQLANPTTNQRIKQTTKHQPANVGLFQLPPINGWYYLHFIGHLQTNKVKILLPHLDLLQSLDSLSLALALEKASAERERILPCFLQLNLSEDTTRFGFTPQTLREALPTLAELKHLAFWGLMTMAPFTADTQAIRKCFQALRALKLELGELTTSRGYKNFHLRELSMGMSQDFEIGLEEGATCIRVGSAIFK